jgi:hypothetical protein
MLFVRKLNYMKAELQKKLVEKYPHFFDYLKKYSGPVIPIQFGFECGDGWFVLINSLMDCIHSHIESKKKYPDTQIKSKFWRIILPKLLHWFRYRKLFYKPLLKFEKKLKREVIPAPVINLTQVKEKFGGLRFYYDGGNDYIDGMVRLAEDLSYKTCEYCSSTENVGQTRGWIVTLCKKCFDEGKTNLKTWELNED